jgi:hypothetical protein
MNVNQQENEAATDGSLLPDFLFPTFTSNTNNNNTSSFDSTTIPAPVATVTPPYSHKDSQPMFSNIDYSNPFMGLPSSMNWHEWNDWFEKTMTSDSTWQYLDS